MDYGFKNIKKVAKTQGLQIFGAAAITMITIFFLYTALETAASVGIVVAIFRLRSLVTTIEGGKFFHETQLLKKSIACTIMIIGAILVVL